VYEAPVLIYINSSTARSPHVAAVPSRIAHDMRSSDRLPNHLFHSVSVERAQDTLAVGLVT